MLQHLCEEHSENTGDIIVFSSFLVGHIEPYGRTTLCPPCAKQLPGQE